MMDFSGGAGAASSFDILPKGLLVFAILTVRGVVTSGTGSRYIDCELTIDEGQPHAGRKIFDKIGDPTHAGNSQGYRDMGNIAIPRILECRGAGPNNPAGYKIDSFDQLSGTRVGIKVGIENGTDGHDDKNRVAEWLTPNPASQSGNKGWVKLVAGDHGLTVAAAPAQAASGFGGFGGAAAAPAQTSGFGNAGGAAAATSGFSAPAGNATSEAASPSTTTTSPSEPGATPGWLGQAQGTAQ